jgi:hypothetical protein
VRDAADLSSDVIRALGEARYAGAAALGSPRKGTNVEPAIAAADEAGLFVLVQRDGEVL